MAQTMDMHLRFCTTYENSTASANSNQYEMTALIHRRLSCSKYPWSVDCTRNFSSIPSSYLQPWLQVVMISKDKQIQTWGGNLPKVLQHEKKMRKWILVPTFLTWLPKLVRVPLANAIIECISLLLKACHPRNINIALTWSFFLKKNLILISV